MRLVSTLIVCTCVLATTVRADVTIVRDRYGVPHLFGDTAADAAYGVGVAQCEDNLPMVVYGLFAGVGRLSELMGATYRALDVEARTLGHGLFAQRDWPKLDPRVRAIVQGYCDGVNAYLKEHPDELPYRVPPVEPVQVIARQRQILLLSALGICRADAEASKSDGYHPVYNPEVVGDAVHPGIEPGKSNSWALAGSRTVSGAPMLLIDPHWPAEGHLQLYEAYLHGGELNAGGFMINGTPLPGLGLSRDAAWTFTAGGADSSDAYALKIHPDDPNQYEFDGKWEPMRVRTETIRIRQRSGYQDEEVQVRETRHGPVLTTAGGSPFAAAMGGYDRADAIEQTYRMCIARSAREFKAAIAMDRLSYFNVMWATRDGHIGYVQTGQVPLRPPEFNWEKMVPGWTSKALYRGAVPFDALPQVVDPPTGFLQNCNTAANVVTPGLTFTREEFPPGALWGHYGQYRARGMRATRLLSELAGATLEDARRIAFDTYVLPADLWVPVILRAYEEASSEITGPPRLGQAIQILRDWDRHASRDSVGATIFRFWRLACQEMAPPIGRDAMQIRQTPEMHSAAVKALATAVDRLQATYGRIDVPWGQIKRLRRGDQEWPLSGDGLGSLGMDTLRATAADRFDAQHKLIANGGQCVTTIVTLADTPVIHSIAAYGQSNKPASPHFADQAPLYSDEQLRAVPWTAQQVAEQAESRTVHKYRPRPIP